MSLYREGQRRHCGTWGLPPGLAEHGLGDGGMTRDSMSEVLQCLDLGIGTFAGFHFLGLGMFGCLFVLFVWICLITTHLSRPRDNKKPKIRKAYNVKIPKIQRFKKNKGSESASGAPGPATMHVPTAWIFGTLHFGTLGSLGAGTYTLGSRP